jgi:hypothetical protein
VRLLPGWISQIHDAVFGGDDSDPSDAAPMRPATAGAAPDGATIPPVAPSGIHPQETTVFGVLADTLHRMQVSDWVVIATVLETELAHHFDFQPK